MSRGSELQSFTASEEQRRSSLKLWSSEALKLHFFELFALANFLVITALLWPVRAPLTMLPRALWIFGFGFLLQVAIGAAIRAIIAWRRGQLREYLGVIRSAQWLFDTLRLAVASALFIHAYG